MTVRFVEMDRLLTTSKRVTKTENKKREERRRGGESREGGRERGWDDTGRYKLSLSTCMVLSESYYQRLYLLKHR